MSVSKNEQLDLDEDSEDAGDNNCNQDFGDLLILSDSEYNNECSHQLEKFMSVYFNLLTILI
jgi:hypothetical protein